MSLQTLFSNASAVARFEAIARNKGYNVFTKRGGFYCLSALNDFAAGYVEGQKEALKNVIVFSDGESHLQIPSPDLSEEGNAAFKAHWDLIQDHCASYAPSRKEACDQHFGRFGDGE